MLSSDILEAQFGPSRLVVLYQDNQHRLIQTVTENNNQILELSLVTFKLQNILTFPAIHQAIVDGTSMGKAYRDANILFKRTVNAIDHVVLPVAFQSHIRTTEPVTVVDVDIYVGDQKTHYCHITEIYSPIVSWPDSVESTDPEVSAKLNNIIQILNTV